MTAQPATIQVQYVNQPREAHWKSGSIKDSNGQYWNVPKEHLAMFTQGETCDVLWEQSGKYPSIVGKGGNLFSVAPTQPQPGSAVPRNANWPGPQTGQREYTREPITQPQESYKARSHPEEVEGMFIMGVVGRAMGSGSFVIEQIPELTRVAAYAWRTRHLMSIYQEQTDRAAHEGRPAHGARSDIDSQYGGDHPDSSLSDIPMGDPSDPGPFGTG